MGLLLLECGAINSKGEEFRPVLEAEEFDGKKLVGVCGLARRRLLFPALYLAVDEGFRGRGIGTRLLGEIIKIKRGPIFLSVTVEDSVPLRMYRKAGFRKLFRWRKFRGIRTMVMVKW